MAGGDGLNREEEEEEEEQSGEAGTEASLLFSS
jgi:hypothetical protein